MSLTIAVLREDWSDPTIPLPDHATAGAAGADLRANLHPVDRSKGLTLLPGARVLVPTGLIVAIPEGYEMQVRPRSGLALKHGVGLLNSPGTIDSDYRGPLGVVMINLGEHPFVIAHGDRIAQAIIAPVVRARYLAVRAVSATQRGAGGFGSTGLN